MQTPNGTLRNIEDDVQSALDACCAAVHALEYARAKIARRGDPGLAGVAAAHGRAVELMRGSIAELRERAGPAATNPLALGFALPLGDGDPASCGQARSLRTA